MVLMGALLWPGSHTDRAATKAYTECTDAEDTHRLLKLFTPFGKMPAKANAAALETWLKQVKAAHVALEASLQLCESGANGTMFIFSPAEQFNAHTTAMACLILFNKLARLHICTHALNALKSLLAQYTKLADSLIGRSQLKPVMVCLGVDYVYLASHSLKGRSTARVNVIDLADGKQKMMEKTSVAKGHMKAHPIVVDLLRVLPAGSFVGFFNADIQEAFQKGELKVPVGPEVLCWMQDDVLHFKQGADNLRPASVKANVPEFEAWMLAVE